MTETLLTIASVALACTSALFAGMALAWRWSAGWWRAEYRLMRAERDEMLRRE